MRGTKTFFIFAGILLFLYSGSATALDSVRDAEPGQPDIKSIDSTSVIAETMDFSTKTSMLAFRKNVMVSNSQYILKCNTLLISSDKDNKPESMQAEGNVRLKAENGEATCKKATYSKSSDQFILEHDAVLKQENSILSADRIIVTVKDGQFEGIRGEGNVRGYFPLEQVLPDKKSLSSDKDNSMIP